MNDSNAANLDKSQRLAQDLDREKDDVQYRCPQCHGDNLDVQISTWARLNQNPEDPHDFSTDADDAQFGDHEWDGASMMQCRDCGHCDEAHKFGPFEAQP